jgi:hypothetical protein
MTPEMGEERILAIFSADVAAFHTDTLRRKALTSKLHRFGLHKQNDRSARNYAGVAVWRLPRISGVCRQQKRGALVRPGILAALMVALAACSSSTPPPPSDPTASAAILKKDCSDPKWQQENLGLWYSVCRQPLRW